MMTTPSPSFAVASIQFAVPSLSAPGTLHRVVVDADGYHCPCKGYQFRGSCRHIRLVRSGSYVGKPRATLAVQRERNPAAVLYED